LGRWVIEDAKMTGMTLEGFILNGMYVLCAPYIFLPITLFA
jgi:hypothetical protein